MIPRIKSKWIFNSQRMEDERCGNDLKIRYKRKSTFRHSWKYINKETTAWGGGGIMPKGARITERHEMFTNEVLKQQDDNLLTLWHFWQITIATACHIGHDTTGRQCRVSAFIATNHIKKMFIFEHWIYIQWFQKVCVTVIAFWQQVRQFQSGVTEMFVFHCAKTNPGS